MSKSCGQCSLCCTLLPVPPMGKPGFQRCPVQQDHGCAIYAMRPNACRQFTCVWLHDDDMPDAARPDRCGVVFDTQLDVVYGTGEDGSERAPMKCVQVWVDPKRPDASREGEARRHIMRAGDLGYVCIIRIAGDLGEGQGVAAVVHATSDGTWIENKNVSFGADVPETPAARVAQAAIKSPA